VRLSGFVSWVCATCFVPIVGVAASGVFVEPTVVSRFEGSVIKDQAQVAFDRTTLTTGVASDGSLLQLSFEGSRLWTAMQGPRGRSGFEVFASYREAISKAGFQFVYACSREQCPSELFRRGLGGDAYSAIPRALTLHGDGSIEDRHYLLAKRGTPAGDEYLRVAVAGPKLPVAVLDLLQPAVREQKVGVLSMDMIATDIARTGKAMLYAVYFDFDKAVVKPESGEQLVQLAAYLSANPGVNVYVVGHTDGKGALDYNASLSQQRAAAIVSTLTQNYRISATRVSPQAVGELAPVSTNETESGRALNRRVEIVKRID
jgi:OmpA-OmpF porin, OOP family